MRTQQLFRQRTTMLLAFLLTFAFTASAQNFSGRVTKTGTNIGLSGIVVRAQAPAPYSYLYTSGTTDANGYWSASVPSPAYSTPGNYRFTIDAGNYCSGLSPAIGITRYWPGSGNTNFTNMDFTISNPPAVNFFVNNQTIQPWQTLSLCDPTSVSFTNMTRNGEFYRFVVYYSNEAGDNLGELPCSQQYNG